MKKNSTVKYFKNAFFGTLMVPTLRFGRSFFLPITFYSNLFWRGVWAMPKFVTLLHCLALRP